MRRLLTARWLIGHLIVAMVAITCILLGSWQLDRLEERRLTNSVHASRYAEPPQPLDGLVAAAGDDIDSLDVRRATVTGEFVPREEVLIRSQVLEGIAGFHVVTPLVTGEGRAVAVNRGWVPLEFDTVPVTAAPPPPGTVTVTGLIRLSEGRGALSRDDAGATTLTRVDLELIDGVVTTDLYPVYLELVGRGSPIDLPAALPPPDFAYEGPHLSYAIQWFSFAAVGAVGYGFLLRRALRSRSLRRRRQPVDDLDPGERDEIRT